MKKYFTGIIKNKKGSMSVESAIVIFIMLILFITVFSILKIFITDYNFNEIVNDTALQSARNGYLIRIIDDGREGLNNKIMRDLGFDIILKDMAYDGTHKVKEDIFYEIIKQEMSNKAIEKGLDPDKIQILKVEIPGNIDIGASNDIYINAVYNTKFNIPFLEEKQIIFKQEARVKCWIDGSNRIYSSEINGSEGFEELKNTYKEKSDLFSVYITKTGTKYHSIYNCRGVNNSKYEYVIPLYDAISKGYVLCKFCARAAIDKTGAKPKIETYK